LKKILFTVILMLSLATTKATKVDSLLQLINQAALNQKADLYIQLSDCFYEDSLPLALKYAQEALAFAKKSSNILQEGDAWVALGELYIHSSNCDSAIHFFDKAIDCYKIEKQTSKFIKTGIRKSECLKQIDRYDDSKELLNNLVKPAQEGKEFKLLSKIYEQLAYAYFTQSDFEKTIEVVFKRLEIDSLLQDSISIAEDYNSLSTNMRKQGKYIDAIAYAKKALEIFEKKNNNEGLANTYSTMGSIYYFNDDNDQAIRHFLKSTEIWEKNDPNNRLAGNYNNIGSVYIETFNYGKALEYYKKALQLYRKQKKRYVEAILTGNIGLAYQGLGDFSKAMDYFTESLELQTQVGNKEGVIHAITNIAGLNYRKGNYEESQKDYFQALDMAKKGGFLAEELSIHKELSILEEAMGHFDKALESLKAYQVIKDTLQNQEARTQLNEFQAQLDLQEHKAEIAILSKENELANVEVKKQRIFTISVVLVSFLLIILIFIISYALSYSRKAKKLLEIQNHEIDKHRNEIQLKNKQFTDSIVYASRVQKALFSPWEELERFFDGMFVISKPQNIVSGDFYWYKFTNNKLYLALADCTGHGVPGAFMSVLGNTFLNEVVEDNCNKQANQVLNELREKIKASLHQEGMKGNTDGMDILLCIISPNENKLSYSGANNPLYLVRNKNLIEYKADKMTISVSMKESPFTTETINLEPGDQFFLSSDGYYDQFGGPRNEKLSRNRFKEMLVRHCEMPLKDQGNELEQLFESWKNNQEQTDDMMVIGFRIK